jgi:energy-coupling factor transporter ATP-binding protein EcfA2
MPKSIFRILAFKCLRPTYPVGVELHYVSRMQRSLAKESRWYTFYNKASISEDGRTVVIPNGFTEDTMLYDSGSISVSISAIVGENGSGKSSILDMMVRTLNNIATAFLGEKPQYAAAEHVHYIEYVYGSILFLQGHEIKRIDVEGRKIQLVHYRVYNGNGVAQDRIEYHMSNKEVLLDVRNNNVDNLLSRRTQSMRKLAELFYTIVCNYSLYAYNPSDYWEEYTNEERIDKIRPKQNYLKYPYLRCWLTGLFHKNDGYQIPLVLNPMRMNGVINAPKENRLAKERLLSMLFYKEDNNENSSYYPFKIINKNHVIVGLSLNDLRDENYIWTRDWMIEKGLFGIRSRLYRDFERISNEIVNYLVVKEGIDTNGAKHKLACRYVVYKILKIGKNYKKYNKILSNLRKTNCSLDLLHHHIDELLYDYSHITMKLRRTLMYLESKIYDDGRQVYKLKDIEEKAKTFIADYNLFNELPHRELADFLPPPIFDIEFQIVKRENIDENGNYNEQNIIPFWSLSSGERQIAYIISNFVYHVVNINSVHYNEVDVVANQPLLKYKYINVIFDEIELYFHPDLQRRFLFLIVEALKSIHIEYIEGINILLVTHSPFVLSDLPKSNVLALSRTNEDVVGETFCANIQEMLGQNFFMEYSMGKIAQKQVEEIFCTYNHIAGNEHVEISEEDWKRFSYVTSIVGDEYLHSSLSRVMKILESYRNGRIGQ